MKIAAVIAEYNPFHNGHLYQLDTIRSELGADRIIVVMSGDFAQRGIPAIVDKYARCRMALENGADLVLELPVYFALGSAEYFAQGAVSLLDKLGVVDFVHFGSECGDIDTLKYCAKAFSHETPEYKALLNNHLRQGLSFPAARSRALCAISSAVDTEISFEKILSTPNNNLGIEYIKALLQRNSAITPVTLERKGGGYHSSALNKGEFASANALRSTLSSDSVNIEELQHFLPESVVHYFKNSLSTAQAQQCFLFADDFSGILHYRLLMEQFKNRDSFVSFYDISQQLSNTLCNTLPDYNGFSNFALCCKSKNLTYTRISRCLMHILLDMKEETINELKAHDYSQYARVLGFREGSKDIFRLVKANSSIPIVTKLSTARKELDPIALSSLNADITASNIYESVKLQKMTLMSHNRHVLKMPSELTRQIIKLP